MCSVEKSRQMKGTTELPYQNKPSSKEGNMPNKASAQLKWLVLLWAASVGVLAIVAGIIWLLMHSAGMTS